MELTDGTRVRIARAGQTEVPGRVELSLIPVRTDEGRLELVYPRNLILEDTDGTDTDRA